MKHVAVVTGASRGIGLATALALADRGLSVALLGRGSQAMDDALAGVTARGAGARFLRCDVKSREEIDRAATEVLREMGVPLVVVNNAGVVRRGPLIHEIDPDAWDDVMDVNLRGSFLVTRAFLPAMLAARRGRFIQVASISSTIGSPRAASYAASKWGLVGFTKSLAGELAGTGLQAMAILPGSVDTDMLRGSPFVAKMSSSEVAKQIVHLALDAPDAMNGAAVEMFG